MQKKLVVTSRIEQITVEEVIASPSYNVKLFAEDAETVKSLFSKIDTGQQCNGVTFVHVPTGFDLQDSDRAEKEGAPQNTPVRGGGDADATMYA